MARAPGVQRLGPSSQSDPKTRKERLYFALDMGDNSSLLSKAITGAAKQGFFCRAKVVIGRTTADIWRFATERVAAGVSQSLQLTCRLPSGRSLSVNDLLDRGNYQGSAAGFTDIFGKPQRR